MALLRLFLVLTCTVSWALWLWWRRLCRYQSRLWQRLALVVLALVVVLAALLWRWRRLRRWRRLVVVLVVLAVVLLVVLVLLVALLLVVSPVVAVLAVVLVVVAVVAVVAVLVVVVVSVILLRPRFLLCRALRLLWRSAVSIGRRWFCVPRRLCPFPQLACLRLCRLSPLPLRLRYPWPVPRSN